MVNITHVLSTTQQLFRTSFELKNKSNLRWFPGHMGKGVKVMQQKLKSVDCIIEVHDARIPFSGRNPDAFQTITGLKPHIIVYNKRDLADECLEGKVLQNLKERGVKNVLFTNCKEGKTCDGINKLIPMVQRAILSSNRYNRSENKDNCLMVIGVPNVGKSSLINVLRNKHLLKSNAVRVGAVAGITRNVGEKVKISEDPLVYVYDTPGILTPKVPSLEVGMKLALCANIPDKEVGIELIADYLLFWLNKNGNFRYVEYLDIEKASDNIVEVLACYAVKKNLITMRKDVMGHYVKRPNVDLAADHFVTAFRKGLFGQITLDNDLIGLYHKDTTYVKRRSENI